MSVWRKYDIEDAVNSESTYFQALTLDILKYSIAVNGAGIATIIAFIIKDYDPAKAYSSATVISAATPLFIYIVGFSSACIGALYLWIISLWRTILGGRMVKDFDDHGRKHIGLFKRLKWWKIFAASILALFGFFGAFIGTFLFVNVIAPNILSYMF